MATEDWSKFFNQDINSPKTPENKELEIEDNRNNDIVQTKDIEDTEDTDEEGLAGLTATTFKEFCDRLTGVLPSGETKSIVTYQNYNVDSVTGQSNDTKQEIIYSLNKVTPEISFDEVNADLVMVTFKFKTYDEQELRLFWARLQKWRTSLSKPMENGEIPIFTLHFLERESIGSGDKGEDYTILECNIINPLICFLTREMPTMEAIDMETESGAKTGGNVVKMLCATECTTFTVRNDLDINAIKAEVEREIEDERYINAEAEGYINDTDDTAL